MGGMGRWQRGGGGHPMARLIWGGGVEERNVEKEILSGMGGGERVVSS